MLAHLKIIWQFHAHPVHQKVSRYIGDDFFLGPNLVRDSSVVRRHYIFLLEPSNVRAQYIRNTADLSSGSAHFHVSWLLDFINYQKPLYKSLHQSIFYSFITILPSESGVTLHYSTILP
jgi:hypothetical protein